MDIKCVCTVDKDGMWVKVFFHDFQLKWAFPLQDCWPRWSFGFPLCCFCREINKWTFDRQLSNFLFIQLGLLLCKRLPGINWNNADEDYLEKRFPWDQQWYYGLHRCFLMFVASRRRFGNLKLLPDQMKLAAQRQSWVSQEEWTSPTFEVFWKWRWIPKMSLWTCFVKWPISLSSNCFCLGEKQRSKLSLHRCFNSGPFN